MTKTVTCRCCGSSFSASEMSVTESGPLCSAGCGLVGRIPIDAHGQYPVNGPLLTALALGLLYFNQCLFALLARTAVQPARLELARRFLWVSAVAGILVWIGVWLVSLRLHVFRKQDIGVVLTTLVIWGLAGRSLPPEPLEALGANTVLLVWSVRGVIKKRFTRKNTVRI